MMTTLSACSTLHGSPSNIAVGIPRDCERLAQRVPFPANAKGDGAKLQLAKHRGALGRANNNLDATRECQVNQRQRFANPRSVK